MNGKTTHTHTAYFVQLGTIQGQGELKEYSICIGNYKYMKRKDYVCGGRGRGWGDNAQFGLHVVFRPFQLTWNIQLGKKIAPQ